MRGISATTLYALILQIVVAASASTFVDKLVGKLIEGGTSAPNGFDDLEQTTLGLNILSAIPRMGLFRPMMPQAVKPALSSPTSFEHKLGMTTPAPRAMQAEAARQWKGTVIEDTKDKTATVLVERIKVHPLYKKHMRIQKRYHAHDPDNTYKEGDIVRIEASGFKWSKIKAFHVVEKLGHLKKESMPMIRRDHYPTLTKKPKKKMTRADRLLQR